MKNHLNDFEDNSGIRQIDARLELIDRDSKKL